MNIAFCINRLALLGLGVTISSLVRNCSDSSRLDIWFICSDLTDKDKSLIKKLLVSEDFLGNFQLVDFNPKNYFGSFCSLHGDWTTYGRLLLADILEIDQVLYLDADLIVERDVLEVDNFNLGNYFLAAVGGGKFKYTLGNTFYVEKLGIPPETEYFNAGILLLNLKAWRIKKVIEECFYIAKQYPMELPSHDQSLLNIICAGRFLRLPPSFNCEWLAFQPRPGIANEMILHFVGSPKPWDSLAFLFHKGYSTWRVYLTPEWKYHFGRHNIEDYRRAWKIRNSYLRTIKNRLKSITIGIVI